MRSDEEPAFSSNRLMEIVRQNLAVFREIEAFDVECRSGLSRLEKREISPWIMMGRERLRDDEFRIWVDLDAGLISDQEAIRRMLALMRTYYGSALSDA